MDEEFVKAEKLFNDGELDGSLKLLNISLQSGQPVAERLLLRAKIYYRLQRWGEALNDLNLIIENEPENQAAINYRSMVLDIIRFWNKDNFNP